MDAISALTMRKSFSRLMGPPPTKEQLDILLQSACRAADHGNLQPWRFISIEGQALQSLGEVYLEAALRNNAEISPALKERFANMPLRAPMILTVVAKVQDHPKVPKIEQLLAAGAAAQNIINAAFALGLGAIWRTGEFAFDRFVCEKLGLSESEQIVGFIYLGHATDEISPPKTVDSDKFLTHWLGN